jgi:hypothetical protein
MLSTIIFVAWLILPLSACIFRERIPCVCRNFPALFIATLVVGYCLYVGSSRVYGYELERALYKFDIDGDRSLSDAEMTPQAKEAMDRLVNDTGRALAPITGVLFTLIWVSLNFVPFIFVTWLWPKLVGKQRGRENNLP